MEWHGMAWHGMAWNGIEWNGMAWNGMISTIWNPWGFHMNVNINFGL
jgi:hypothetical protein